MPLYQFRRILRVCFLLGRNPWVVGVLRCRAYGRAYRYLEMCQRREVASFGGKDFFIDALGNKWVCLEQQICFKVLL